MSDTVITYPPKINYDYHWTLKSTTEERGRVLLGIGAEWSGSTESTDGSPAEREVALDVDWATANAAELIATMMVVLRDAGVEPEAVIGAAMASYAELTGH